jgi:hypothetical protein
MQTKWSEDELRTLEALCAERLTWVDRAKRINKQYHRSRNVRSRAACKDQARAKGLIGTAADAVSSRFGAARPDLAVETTDKVKTVTMYARDIRTLEDLIAYADVDMTKWTAERFKCNKWDMGSIDIEGAPQATPLYQVTADFKPVGIAVQRLDQLRTDLLADIRAEGAAAEPARFGTIFANDADVMLELGLPDLHLGKYAWDEETGNNYNTEIASELFKDAFESLLERAAAFSPGRVVLPIGNDFFHIDNRQNQTTAGTPQDADTRYFKLIRRGRSLYAWAIKRCVDAVGPVQCVIVPGNHDLISTTFLGEVLSAQFEANPYVGLDDSLYPRKYVQHGSVLLGYCHGNTEKNSDLPMLMAKEQRHAWSQTTHHEWHIGHLHKSKETRYIAGDSHHGGVRIRILPSLSGTDYWHATKGYTGELRAAEAYLWSAGQGYLGHLNFSARVESEIACIKL